MSVANFGSDGGAEFNIPPPCYPLSREAFRRALKTGHGRALLHAEQFGVENFRDDILEAALVCLVYDTQSEGHREWWLTRLSEIADLVGTVINSDPAKDHHDLNQYCRLLKQLHENGNEHALPRLYAMCRYSKESNKLHAIEELIEIDGEKALVFVARRLGESLAKYEDFRVSDYEISCFDEIHGSGAGRLILDEKAEEDESIKFYLGKVSEYQRDIDPDSRVTIKEGKLTPVGEVLRSIESEEKSSLNLRRWGREASLEDRMKVQDLLKPGASRVVLTKILRIFAATGFPRFSGDLLWLVFDSDEAVASWAAKVLSHHDGPEVRQAALVMLARDEFEKAITLLRRSAKIEDASAILIALGRVGETENTHHIIFDLIRLLEVDESFRSTLIPLHVYEFSPCMQCRKEAFEILLKHGDCPSWVLTESLLDAYDSIRDLAIKSKHG